jgi:O-acetyl-ADP-ribose deacetylase (regulator of RNase III)
MVLLAAKGAGMIEFRQGDLLEADAEALVNTVNCVGVMGKGIALQFKRTFPDNFRQYEQACKTKEVVIGRMFVVRTGKLTQPYFIINFPTKKHWKGKSKLEDIRLGLDDLARVIVQYGIKSIAVPPLGCGNGGLDWNEVYPLIEGALASLPDVRVLVYAPQPGPRAAEMKVATKRPAMTRAKALFVLLFSRYHEPGYRLTKLEAQKLAYFLQVAGEKLRLKFVKHHFGPYADNLNHLLLDMDGHYIRGFGDRGSDSSIYPLPEAIADAREFLRQDQEAASKLERVSQLIKGFEDSYGLELLASLHWVAANDLVAANEPDTAIALLHAWNDRKRKLFRAEHAVKAWKRLWELDWLGAHA